MNGAGYEVGRELGRAAAGTKARVYRIARVARVADGAALVICLFLMCLGVRAGWAATYFAVSTAVDLVACRILNPKRRKREALK